MTISKHFIVEIIRFGIVGVVGFCINYAILLGLDYLGIVNKLLSELVAILVALQFTFILHDIWTYKQKNDSEYKLYITKRYFTYLSSSAIGSLITIATYAILFGRLNRLSALAIGAVLGMFWNFCINHFFIWKHQRTIE